MIPIKEIEAKYILDNKESCERFGGVWYDNKCWFDLGGDEDEEA